MKELLTKKELVVLQHLALGMQNTEIAGAIFRSVKTVEAHRHRMLQKLKARNAVQMVLHAIQRGIIPPPLPDNAHALQVIQEQLRQKLQRLLTDGQPLGSDRKEEDCCVHRS